MKTEQHIQDLKCQLKEGRRRGESEYITLCDWLNHLVKSQSVTPELLYALHKDQICRENREHSTPKGLNRFIKTIAHLNQAQSILDPTCGQGLLLNEVAGSPEVQIIHGIDIDEESCNLAKTILGDKATVINARAFSSNETLLDKYDLIVAHPPLNAKIYLSEWATATKIPWIGNTGFSSGLEPHCDLDLALAVWACARLTEKGTAIIVLPPSFIWGNKGKKFQQAVAQLGCRIRALLHLPGGTIPNTSLSSYLVVFEHGSQGKIFVGEYTDSEEQLKTLIANYTKNRSSEHPALGRQCELKSFLGFSALVAKERLNQLVRASGWIKNTANNIITNYNFVSEATHSEEQETNIIYLRKHGPQMARMDLEGLNEVALKNTYRLTICPKFADARYLVHWFNQSPIGLETVASLSRSSFMPRLDMFALMEQNLYLPPLNEQLNIIKGIDHLNRIRSEVLELNTALLANTEKTDDICQKIQTINHQDNQHDHYKNWIETLPFPLSSILWRHCAGIDGQNVREQYETLLHFFEATAAFIAIIHLSAFMSDEVLWSETAPGLINNMKQQKLSFDHATFGAWKGGAEYLSGRCRALLANDDGRTTCSRIYGTTNLAHISKICCPEILAVLQQANAIRNQTTGHGGAMGIGPATIIHEQLNNLVSDIRGIFGRSWLEYQLIQPSRGEYNGSVHSYNAKRLMGSRSAPFETTTCNSSHTLRSDRLYLFDSMSQSGLLIVPLIRVMPSPDRRANACFIFSKSEKNSSRFISYHFEAESNLTESCPDVEETFRRIHLFDEIEQP